MLSFATKHNNPEVKLGWNERIGYGTGLLGMNLVNGVFASFLSIYFTNAVLLDAAVISSIMAVSKIFDGISDIVVGRVVDRTKSKMGKARVWLIRMCIPLAVSTMLLFCVPADLPEMAKYVYVFLMYNITLAVCYTGMFVPYASMISLMTRNRFERGMLSNISQIFSTLANVIINTFFIAMLTKFTSSAETIYTQRAFTLTMLIFCGAMLLLTAICVIFTKERTSHTEESGALKQGKEKSMNTLDAVKALLHNKYWLILTLAMFTIFFVVIMYSMGSVYYAQYIFRDPNQFGWMTNTINIAQFAIMFIIPFFMKRFGKSKIYISGLALMAAGFTCFGLAGENIFLMGTCNVLKGIGLGMAGGMALGMVADTIDYGKMKNGVDVVGVGNAGISAAQKIGLGLGTAVFGWVMSAAGFDGALDIQGIAQPESVITAIQVMYNWVPAVMCAIIFLIMLFTYDIEKKLVSVDSAK